MENKDKLFEINDKNNKTVNMSYVEISRMMLSGMFMMVLKEMKVDEILFNYDIMADIRRIK